MQKRNTVAIDLMESRVREAVQLPEACRRYQARDVQVEDSEQKTASEESIIFQVSSDMAREMTALRRDIMEQSRQQQTEVEGTKKQRSIAGRMIAQRLLWSRGRRKKRQVKRSEIGMRRLIVSKSSITVTQPP